MKSTHPFYLIYCACLGILGTILFSSKSVFAKMAYQYQVDSTDLLLMRMVFALPMYLLFLYWVHLKKTPTSISKNDFLQLLLIGFIGYYLASYLDFLGLEYISASLERLILFIYPSFVTLFTLLLYKRKIRKSQIVALIFTYFGIYLAVANDSLGGKNLILGSTIILLSGLCFSIYILLSEKLIKKFGSSYFTTLNMSIASVFVVFHYFIFSPNPFRIYPMNAYFYGMCIAFFATFIPSFLMAYSIKTFGADKASIINTFGPIATIFLSYLFLNEQLSLLQFVGAFFVIVGIGIIVTKKPKIVVQEKET